MKSIYLDHHATTPMDERVLQAMLPYFTEVYGNPASDHLMGKQAEVAVAKARNEVASLLACRDDEIFFTSGATESNNWALRGVAQAAGKPIHIVTSAIEHKSVLETCALLENHGHRVSYIPCDKDGRLRLDELRQALTPQTALVSVMLANNETGAIQPLQKISEVAHAVGAVLHSDAAQAVGHIDVNPKKLGIDLMSFSAHKMYGPKGIGGLYVRRRPIVPLSPLIVGGGQERNQRSGTLNVPGIVGFGAAAHIARKELRTHGEHAVKLRKALWQGLQAIGAELVGPEFGPSRLAHNVLFSLPGVEARAILQLVRNDVALSTGSACQAEKVEESHVLRAMGLGEACHHVLRIGLGRQTTVEEIEVALAALRDATRRVAAARLAPA